MTTPWGVMINALWESVKKFAAPIAAYLAGLKSGARNERYIHRDAIDKAREDQDEKDHDFIVLSGDDDLLERMRDARRRREGGGD